VRIGFDASVAAGQPGGTGTYAVQLLNALIPLRPDWTFHLYFRRPDEPNQLLLGPPGENVRRSVVSGSPNTWRIQAQLPKHLRRDGVDIYHSPGVFLPLRWPGLKVVSIHDLNIYRHVRNWLHRGTLIHWLDLASQTPISVGVASRIITPSESASRDLQRLLRVRPDRIRVIPDAPDLFFDEPAYESEIDAANQLAADRPFILFVGVLSPQKNLRGLLQAFAASGLPAQGITLVLAGRDLTGYGRRLRDLAERLGIGKAVRLPGYVSRATLRALCGQAVCVVLPSHGEGFGLPLVEAMACGAPIIAADRQAIPEVLGGAGALFDPLDSTALKGLLRRVVEDNEFRSSLRERGRERRKEFSWTRTAEATAGVYSELLGA
jgi:glycosyltransferase involved in cell wall biosynthesis